MATQDFRKYLDLSKLTARKGKKQKNAWSGGSILRSDCTAPQSDEKIYLHEKRASVLGLEMDVGADVVSVERSAGHLRRSGAVLLV